MASLAWVVFALPAIAFLLIGLVTLSNPRLSSLISILAVAGSWVLALVVFAAVAGGARLEQGFPWLSIGPDAALPFGIRVDSLSAMMLVVVTTVSLLIQVYSLGYMAGDPGFARYYCFLSLFTFSMLGLVLAANLLTIFIFWEGVGVCSYLLIGHWFAKPEAAEAAKKAFVTTRFGDFGFLIGILLLFTITARLGEPTLDFARLAELAENGQLMTFGSGLVTVAAVLLFCGAIGKSAQFPLHVWLPDAMEGPTRVSALIHAATMVAAGVYLVARAFPLFETVPTALTVVAIIGGFTAIFAATMGLVANDLKRVLAYSTVSQLGYMMLGLGSGALVAGTFHLFTHAFFKALLFLTAGSVIHAIGTQDLREMGGLRRYMPITFATMGFAGAALAGIPPLSGFWSKDEVLAAAYSSGNWVLFLFAMITVFLTAFYMFRAWFMTFFGEWRGGRQESSIDVHAADAARIAQDVHGTHGAVHAAPHGGAHAPGSTPHESPAVMSIPLLILLVPTLVSGFWALLGPASFAAFIEGKPEPFRFDPVVGGLSIVLAVLGIGLAYLIYGARAMRPISVQPLYELLAHKYWIDEIYNKIMDVVILAGAQLVFLFDLRVIDGIVDGIGRLAVGIGYTVRTLQSGRVQAYAMVVFGGLLVIMVFTTLLPLLGVGTR